MSWLDSKRIAVPDEGSGRESSKGDVLWEASEYRERLDDSCINEALRLGMREGVILNVGCGSGAIALKLARRCPEVTVLGIDPSPAAIAAATEKAEEERLQHRVHFQTANLKSTRFKVEYFDGALFNERLCRSGDPAALLNEIARVVKKDGAVLVRDLRRPSWLSAWWHTRWFGRKFSAGSRENFRAAVRAAYSYSEWRELLHRSNLRDSAQIVVRDLLFIAIERPAQRSLFVELEAKRERRESLAGSEGWRKDL